MSRPPLPSPALAVSVVALVVCTAGLAIAAGSGTSGSIRACAAKKDGALRILTKGRCTGSERAISWDRAASTTVTTRTQKVAVELDSCIDFLGAYGCSGQQRGTAKCKPGERATGGGFSPPENGSASATESAPSPKAGTPKGWTVTVSASTAGTTSEPPPVDVELHVVCVAP